MADKHPPVWILCQLSDCRGDDALHVRMLDVVPRAVVVLVNRLQPADVVMRVRNEGDIQNARGS